jgi:hypothetical protein
MNSSISVPLTCQVVPDGLLKATNPTRISDDGHATLANPVRALLLLLMPARSTTWKGVCGAQNQISMMS